MADTKNTQKATDTQVADNLNEVSILKYKTPIIGGIVALLVCVGGYFIWNSLSSSKQEEASTHMAKAQEYFLNAINSND